MLPNLNRKSNGGQDMKRVEIGTKVVVNLGRKFGGTRVVATYEGTYHEDKDASVVKPIDILVSNQPFYILSALLNTQMIVDNKQVLCKW